MAKPEPAAPLPQTGVAKVYDKEALAALVECCTRLFCCDEEIVIADFLVQRERAFCERDLESELGLAERQLRQHLARLERHGLVARVVQGEAADIYQRAPRSVGEGGAPQPGAQSFWRISHWCIVAIHYKLRKMEEWLSRCRQLLHQSDGFTCPACRATFDGLEVQKLEVDGFDARFLCYCGAKVELDDKTAKDNAYSSQQQRCELQIQNLKRCLHAVWGMEVPRFALHRKSHPTETPHNPTFIENASAVSVGSEASGAAERAPASVSAVSDTPRVAAHPRPAGPGAAVGKIKFHLGGAHAAGPRLQVNLASPTNTRSPTGFAGAASVATAANAAGDASVHAPAQAAPPQGPEEPQAPPQGPAEAMPSFFLSQLGVTVSLLEASKYQKSMTQAEFEQFVQLQETWLDVI